MTLEHGLAKQRERVRVLRLKVWRGMRILRKFTVMSLLSTTGEPVEKGDVKTIANWISHLTFHGYVGKLGERSRQRGDYQTYILLKNPVSMPIVCDECGVNIFRKGCSPLFFQKERQREIEKEREKEKNEEAVLPIVRITDTQWTALKQLTDGTKEDHA